MKNIGYLIGYLFLFIGFAVAAIGLAKQSKDNSDMEHMVIATGMVIFSLGCIVQILMKWLTKKNKKNN